MPNEIGGNWNGTASGSETAYIILYVEFLDPGFADPYQRKIHIALKVPPGTTAEELRDRLITEWEGSVGEKPTIETGAGSSSFKLSDFDEQPPGYPRLSTVNHQLAVEEVKLNGSDVTTPVQGVTIERTL